MSTHTPAPSHPSSPPPASLDDTQPVITVQADDQGWRPWLIRLPVLLLTGLALLLILAILFVAAFQTRYAGRVYPGVSAFGVALSDLGHAETARLLDSRFTYDEQAVFTFRDGDRTWMHTAGELGVSFDARATADNALLVGRGGGLVDNLLVQADTWLNGRAISPLVLYDQTRAEARLRAIAAEIDRPAQDAALAVRGTEVLATEAQVGRTLDIPATLVALRGDILNLQSGAEIPLVINETPPTVWSTDEAESRLRAALSGPLSLYADPDSGGQAGPWAATPEQIAQMIEITREDQPDGTALLDVHLDLEQFTSFLGGIAPQLTTEPQPARLTFDSATGALEVLQSSVSGRALDVETTLAAIEETLFAPPPAPGEPRMVPLAFTYTEPAVHDDATAEALGITELVAEATTYYLGSSAGRQQNIIQSADQFHGVVIGPGEEFSFNEWVGDISLEAGYEESFIIFGGRTIEGVGGGVCQVSTTVFQAAFYAGYPILERYPHGYRVGYYEYGEGVGMDATVYSPLVDFRFLNDTPYHLLIETETNTANSTITFRFYSTGMGRVVNKVGPRIANVTPHGDTVYEESADLYPGQRRQVEWAVDGADVTVTRQVFRNGELEQEDHFFSHYLPWNAVIQVAPGELPPA
ncbi:MAG: VanW family protein [Anaerolineae bacterium]|nr:VanW family protein [Anaerolineae bacterium]